MLAFAIGLRLSLRPLSLWGPLLVGLVGIGLIGSGIFVTDPVNGYPPGTPLKLTEYSDNGFLHDLFGVPIFLVLPITCLVFARRFAKLGERSWAVYSVLSRIAMFAFFVLAGMGFDQEPGLAEFAGVYQRLSLIFGLGWIMLLAVHLHDPRRRKDRQETLTKGHALIVDVPATISSMSKPPIPAEVSGSAKWLDSLAEVYNALVLGARDYVRKNSFRKVVVGLSGGIDSSLVATLATAALGPENVIGVSMPSRYSSEGSTTDAVSLTKKPGHPTVVHPYRGRLYGYVIHARRGIPGYPSRCRGGKRPSTPPWEHTHGSLQQIWLAGVHNGE